MQSAEKYLNLEKTNPRPETATSQHSPENLKFCTSCRGKDLHRISQRINSLIYKRINEGDAIFSTQQIHSQPRATNSRYSMTTSEKNSILLLCFFDGSGSGNWKLGANKKEDEKLYHQIYTQSIRRIHWKHIMLAENLQVGRNEPSFCRNVCTSMEPFGGAQTPLHHSFV